jgi:hypothetical protein
VEIPGRVAVVMVQERTHESRLPMVMTLLKWISGPLVGSLYYSPDGHRTEVLIVVWTVVISVFIRSNLAEELLWIPVLLGLSGVFGSIAILAFSGNTALTVNLTTLVAFVIAVDVLKKHRCALVAMKHHAR